MKLIDSSGYEITWEGKNGVRHTTQISRTTPFEMIIGTRTMSRVVYYSALAITGDPYLSMNLARSGVGMYELVGIDESGIQQIFYRICQGAVAIVIRPASMSRNIPLSWERTPEALYVRCHCGRILELKGYTIYSQFSQAHCGVVSPCISCVACYAHFFPLLWKWDGSIILV